MLDPRQWLDLAESMLLIQGHVPGRPPQAVLRRSVSTSYYALFHAATQAAAEGVAPQNGSRERRVLRAALARSVQHKRLLDSLLRLASGPDGFGDAGAAKMFGMLAEDFRTLQEARHDADYNDLATRSFTLRETKLLLQRARRSVDRIQQISAEQRRLLAVGVFGHEGLKKVVRT